MRLLRLKPKLDDAVSREGLYDAGVNKLAAAPNKALAEEVKILVRGRFLLGTCSRRRHSVWSVRQGTQADGPGHGQCLERVPHECAASLRL